MYRVPIVCAEMFLSSFCFSLTSFNLDVRQTMDSQKRLSQQADQLLNKCGKWCLLRNHKLSEAKEGLIEILLEMNSLSKIEKQNLVRERVRESIQIQTNGSAKCSWKIGVAPGIQFLNVCKQCFEEVYDVGHTTLQKRITEIKRGFTEATTFRLNDRTAVPKPAYKAALASAKGNGLNQSRHQAAMMVIPNDMKKWSCYSW